MNRIRFCAVVVVIGAAMCHVNTHAGETALLYVQQAPASWGDAHLNEKLFDRLSGRNGLSVISLDSEVGASVAPSKNTCDVPHAGVIASERGARYLALITNVRTELDTRKGLSIPILLSRYSTVGTVSGTLRVIDARMNRMVYNRDFAVERKATERWQALEDDPVSGDIDLPAARKPLFFEELEWAAAEWLADEIARVARAK